MILILLTWFKGLDLGPLIVILMLPRQSEWISITKSSSVCKHSDPQFLLWDETTKQKNLGIALFHILILLCHRCQNRTSLDGPYITVHGIVPSTFYDVTISDHPPTSFYSACDVIVGEILDQDLKNSIHGLVT